MIDEAVDLFYEPIHNVAWPLYLQLRISGVVRNITPHAAVSNQAY